MKQLKMGTESVGSKSKQVSISRVPPPPPPPLPRFWVRKSASESITKKEIAKFWRQKRVKEEEHLLAAIKAAARIRASNLSEEDYRLFEESLNDGDDDTKEKEFVSFKKEKNNEVRVGIRDWWTKSKYAYLNQPAIGSSMDNSKAKRRASSYTANCFSYKPTPLHPTSLGVF